MSCSLRGCVQELFLVEDSFRLAHCAQRDFVLFLQVLEFFLTKSLHFSPLPAPSPLPLSYRFHRHSPCIQSIFSTVRFYFSRQHSSHNRMFFETVTVFSFLENITSRYSIRVFVRIRFVFTVRMRSVLYIMCNCSLLHVQH